jgi:hypothetical protein
MAYEKSENKTSARASDVRKGHQTERVSGVEKVGGSGGVRFPVHEHHEHCNVQGPGAKSTRG